MISWLNRIRLVALCIAQSLHTIFTNGFGGIG